MRCVTSVIILTFGLMLAACAPTAPAEQPTAAPAAGTLAVGIVLPTKDEPRWIQDETRFKDALTKAGYSAEILFSQGDSAKEKANVEALLTKGIKVLIICPQDGNAAAAAVEEARKAGVKVISYDRLVTNTDAVDFYVTFDSISVGKAQAQYLVDKNTAKGSPLYLYAGAASDNNAFLFFEGAWTVLQPKIADGPDATPELFGISAVALALPVRSSNKAFRRATSSPCMRSSRRRAASEISLSVKDSGVLSIPKGARWG